MDQQRLTCLPQATGTVEDRHQPRLLHTLHRPVLAGSQTGAQAREELLGGGDVLAERTAREVDDLAGARGRFHMGIVHVFYSARNP